MAQPRRQLVAIASLDVAGFTRLIEEDEHHTLSAVVRVFRDRLAPMVTRHGGRIFKTMGDGALIEFSSPVAAVELAAEFQTSMTADPIADAEGDPIEVRIGITLGDVVVADGGDLFGQGVVYAVRIQALSPPGGIAISRGIRDYLQGKLDLEFLPIGPRHLKNFTDPHEVFVWSPAGHVAATGAPPASPPGRPSIVVLPFENLSSDPEQGYFADGMAEELTATLSRIHDFLVIARNTAFTYKGRPLDVRQISRELGVRYVLTGSVRRAGDRVRVTAQLIDAETAAHIWSDKFEGLLANVFDLQDLIARQVTGAVSPSIRAAEIERALRKRPDSLEAYDLVMQALPRLWAHRMVENAEAIELLEQALRYDPQYGLAAGLAAWAHAQQIVYNWTADFEAERAKGLPLIEVAVKNLGDDPTAMTAIASATVLLEGNVRRAVDFIDRALAIDPNHAWAWTRRGYAEVYLGAPENALHAFDMAIRLSPRDPFAFHVYIGKGLSHFAAGRTPDAIAWVRRALDARPGMTWPYRDLAVFLAHAGQIDDARRVLADFTYLRPPMTIRSIGDGLRFMGQPLLGRYLEGLRLAGMPE